MFGGFPFLKVSVEFQCSHSDNRATGVAFALNPLFHPDGPTETRTVRGTKLVVLSAGSFGSPGILERSGIGAKAVLERVGVEQRVDLPGVGENYQGSFLLSWAIQVTDFGIRYAQITTSCLSHILPQMRHRHSMGFFAKMRAQSKVCRTPFHNACHRNSRFFCASSCRLGTRKDWEGYHGSQVRRRLAS